LQQPLREIIDILLSKEKPTRRDLEKAKFEVTRKYNFGYIPSNSEIIRLLEDDERERLIPILRRKATRAMSGVNVVAVMTKPYSCPHGRCAFCPGGPDNDSPQSYTGHEPAAMRGAQNLFDPYDQVRSRVEQLEAIGHVVDKIDLIVMGGTFPASPIDYQRWFMKGCLDAITMKPSESLVEAKLNAETSDIRNVGITFETRPDQLEPHNIDGMLDAKAARDAAGAEEFRKARRRVKENLDRVRGELRGAVDGLEGLEHEIDRRFNRYWGLLFKEGTELSRFGEQLEDYACLYTARVSNFGFYSPNQYFRSQRDLMPHERF